MYYHLHPPLQDLSCTIVALINPDPEAYLLKEEIVISRTLTIMGDSGTLPLIDCRHSERCFRVMVSISSTN